MHDPRSRPSDADAGRPDTDRIERGPTRPLRVGLVVTPSDVRTWMVTLASLLEIDGIARLAAIIEVGPQVAAWLPRDAGPIQRAVVRLDDRLFSRPGAPLSVVDPDVVWPAVVRIDLTAAAPGADGLDERAAADLAGAQLDMLVQPVGRPLAPLAAFARHGVWVFEHGDPDGTSMTPGLRAVLGADETLRSELVAVTGDGRRMVLARTWSAPDLTSGRRSMDRILAKLAAFPARHAARLARRPTATIEDLALEPPKPVGRPRRRSPGAADRAIARALPGHLARLLSRLPERLVWRQHWILAELLDVPEDGFPDPRRYRSTIIEPPSGVSWADPFPVEHDGASLLFMEEWDYATRKGRIALMTRAADGSWGDRRTVLERDVHLSYPFVFEWQGEWYLMPEAMAGRTLDLFRATDFPTRWTFDRHVMEGVQVADATIAEIDGAWWLFAAIAQPGGASTDELHLFSGPGPLGPWRPHPANPIVSDVRSGRPAGRLFRHDGAWYRPSQDCTGRYGRAISLSRIDRLDLDGYAETVIDRIDPEWAPGGLGTHTLNRAGRSVLLDLSVKDRIGWRG